MSKTEELPKEILVKAVKLNGSLKRIFIVLYTYGKPAMAVTVAELVGQSRAYTHMRLKQLVQMDLVKSRREGKKMFFEV